VLAAAGVGSVTEGSNEPIVFNIDIFGDHRLLESF